VTRAEFIQRASIGIMTICKSDGAVREAVELADAMERANEAPWKPPSALENLKTVRDAFEDAAIKGAVEMEREACARIADRNDMSAYGIAQAIRMRGKK
jgi:hypothetical protein